MKKLLAMLMVLAMLLSVCAVAEQTDSAYVKAKGKLVVGVTDFAPMNYKDADGNWIGFDADAARAFAASLGVAVEFIEIEWDSKILELNSKNVDCIWNGMTLTDEVKAAMECSVPYMENGQVIVVKAAVADQYWTEDSLNGLSVAVEAGSAGDAVVTAMGIEPTRVTSQADALMEVAAGTSDAAVIDLLMAASMTGEGTGYADLDFTLSLNVEDYVVGFRKGSDLAVMLNEWLVATYAEGTLDLMAENYHAAVALIEW